VVGVFALEKAVKYIYKAADGSKFEKGVYRMLDAVTKRWEDQSTTTVFKFIFYCDCCGKTIPSPEYPFNSGFKPKLLMSVAERKARELIWLRDHDAAYERANMLMQTDYIHTCEICGSHICGDCAVICDELNGGVCCTACLESKHYHGKKIWQGE